MTKPVTVRRRYSAAELGDVATGLRRLLDAIEAGDLVARPGMVARLEGAWLALEALAAGRPLRPEELLGAESDPPA